MTKKTRKISREFQSIPITLDEVLSRLADPDPKISSRHLAELSDLSPENLRQFIPTWKELAVEGRRHIVSRLAELAEGNVELNFDAIFKLGLEDADSQVRLRSIQGLWESTQNWFLQKLLEILKTDESDEVRIAAAQSLERFCLAAELEDLGAEQKKLLAASLLEVIENDSLPVELRRRGLEAVAPLNLTEVHQAIKDAYAGQSPELKISALYAMGANSNPAWLPYLVSELSSENPEERYEAASACGQLGEEDAVEHLLPLVRDEDTDVQLAAVKALGEIGGQDTRETLLLLTDQPNKILRDAAVQALYELELYQDPFSPGALKLPDLESSP